MSEVGKESIWIKNFITELGMVPRNVDPISIYCDNNEPLHKQRNQSLIKIQKCIKAHNIIREIISKGDIKIEQIPIEENIANLLTKSLSSKDIIVILNHLI